MIEKICEKLGLDEKDLLILELQQRIDKAIEYIGQELLVYDNESDEYKVGIKLLEILKGEDNDR